MVGGKLYELVRDGIPDAVVSDAMGHVRLVLDPAGATVSRFDYDAWGNVLPSSFDNLPSGMPCRYVGAPGVRWDADLGMYYTRHRWFDAGVQRFISRDPLAERSATTYTYAENRPVMFIDPTGLDIAVIYSGGYWKNPFGHAAIAVSTAGVYSYDTRTPPGERLFTYPCKTKSKGGT